MTGYARQVIAETLALPKEAETDLPFDSHVGELRSASDRLMARASSPDRDVPSVEVLARRILEEYLAARKERGWPAARIWYYPEPKTFAAFLSHDVDEVRWSWRRRLLFTALHPSTRGAHPDPYWNFERVMELEKRRGIRSSFFVVPSGRHRRDPPYRLEDLAAVVRMLWDGGWEVGVHGSYESFDRSDLLVTQRRELEAVLGRAVQGVRQHFVNFDSPSTWMAQEAAGFQYDSTLTSRERAGFRVGFCHPYRVEGLRLLEIPLTAMDGQLFWYEKLGPEGAYGRTSELIRTAAAFHGVACLDWHQHTMDELSFPGWWDVFRRLLEDLARLDPWFARGSDLAAWWNRRSQVRFHEAAASRETGQWTVADPTGGPLTLRIHTPAPETGRFRVAGTEDYEILPAVGGAWIRFRDLPAGARVSVSWERET